MKIKWGFHLPRAEAVKSPVIEDRQKHAHLHTVGRRSLWWPTHSTHSWSTGLPLKKRVKQAGRKSERNVVLLYVTLYKWTVFLSNTTALWHHFFVLFLFFLVGGSLSLLLPPLPSPQLRERNPEYSWIQHYAQKQIVPMKFPLFILTPVKN